MFKILIEFIQLLDKCFDDGILDETHHSNHVLFVDVNMLVGAAGGARASHVMDEAGKLVVEFSSSRASLQKFAW